jgi:peptidoglycan/LPS O-acetylase OafA/YrhL
VLHSVKYASDRLEYLDALRGIAAAAVVLEHGLGVCLPGYKNWMTTHFALGQAGVCLFFLISGFIIPLSIETGGSSGRFWRRRFWRLFPLYWFSIGIAWLCGQFGVTTYAVIGWDTWLSNLTMAQEALGRPHVLGVFWTLSLELMLYAGCSLLFSLGLLRRTVLVFGLATAGYLFLVCGWVGGGRLFLLLTALFGMAVQRYTAGRLDRRRLTALTAGLVLALAASVLGGFLHIPQFHLRSIVVAWTAAYAAFAVGLCLRNRRPPRSLTWSGRISYSLYLVHPLVLIVLPTTWSAWLYLSALFGGTFALSIGTYHLIERPGIALGRSLERHRSPSRTPVEPPYRVAA